MCNEKYIVWVEGRLLGTASANIQNKGLSFAAKLGTQFLGILYARLLSLLLIYGQ